MKAYTGHNSTKSKRRAADYRENSKSGGKNRRYKSRSFKKTARREIRREINAG